MGAGILFSQHLKHWLTQRGLWLVVLATLVPTVLMGAWTFTHRADVAAGDVRWEPAIPIQDQPLTVYGRVTNPGNEAVIASNATVIIGHSERRGSPTGVVATVFVEDFKRVVPVPALAPGDAHDFNVTWTARYVADFLEVVLLADSSDVIPEVDEFNNVHRSYLQVDVSNYFDAPTPRAEADLAGDRNATSSADAEIATFHWLPAQPHEGDTVAFQVNVTNTGAAALSNALLHVTVLAQLYSQVPIQGQLIVVPAGTETEFTQTATLTLEPSQTTTRTFNWTDVVPGRYWAQAYIVPQNQSDPDTLDNYDVQRLTVNFDLLEGAPAPAPVPPQKTIKRFYLDVLTLIQLPLLLPLIALYYAGGVLSDDRERGNLSYLLTRPVPRWLIPLARFAASFLIAALAVLAGVAVGYTLLFGLPQTGASYLVTPLIASLVTLFAYGALFTLFGVASRRPYLIGLVFLIGWEQLLRVGRVIQINEQPLVQDWLLNLSLFHHVNKVVEPWTRDDGYVAALPGANEVLNALRVILLIGLGCLVAAMVHMQRREFEE